MKRCDPFDLLVNLLFVIGGCGLLVVGMTIGVPGVLIVVGFLILAFIWALTAIVLDWWPFWPR